MIFRNLFSRKERRCTGREDGLVDTAGEEERGTNGEWHQYTQTIGCKMDSK